MPSAFILALVFISGAVCAADSGPSATPAPQDPALERYNAASASKDWSGAAAAMKEALSRDPNNSDYHNLYAYSLRKNPNPDLDLVFKHYNEALRINPKHRGAHEYIGEAYLMVGNVGKAKEHLGQLDRLCFFSCPEFRDLKTAISEHEKKR
jgi:tetratricopeptide (TPR) repeat protein